MSYNLRRYDKKRVSTCNVATAKIVSEAVQFSWTTRDIHHEMVGAERKTKRQFEAKTEREIRMVGDVLYLKWDQRGICQNIILNSEAMTANTEPISNWSITNRSQSERRQSPK